MLDPAYLGVAFLVSSIGFVMFMYGRKQNRPIQLGSGLLLMLFPYFLRDPLWLGVASTAICAGVWVSLKSGL
jgi:hypothetical protein